MRLDGNRLCIFFLGWCPLEATLAADLSFSTYIIHSSEEAMSLCLLGMFPFEGSVSRRLLQDYFYGAIVLIRKENDRIWDRIVENQKRVRG